MMLRTERWGMAALLPWGESVKCITSAVANMPVRNPSRGTIVQILKENTLPVDGARATLAGRVWRPDVAGPAVVAVRADGVYDVTATGPTIRDLCEAERPAATLRGAAGERIGSLDEILANTPAAGRDQKRRWPPARMARKGIKAGGETSGGRRGGRRRGKRARGQRGRPATTRSEMPATMGTDLRALKPGPP